jgi:hypothetical protein
MIDETPNTLRMRRGAHENFFVLENTMEECFLKRQNVEERMVLQRAIKIACEHQCSETNVMHFYSIY